MRKALAAALAALPAGLAIVGAASADPVNSKRAAVFAATCTGLGQVQLVNTEPAHTEALQVVGSNTVVLVPWNGAPGIAQRGTAAGTTCTFADSPFGPNLTFPVVIVGG
jgi:hypothetical protein